MTVRICYECAKALERTEEMLGALQRKPQCRRCGYDAHAANRINEPGNDGELRIHHLPKSDRRTHVLELSGSGGAQLHLGETADALRYLLRAQQFSRACVASDTGGDIDGRSEVVAVVAPNAWPPMDTCAESREERLLLHEAAQGQSHPQGLGRGVGRNHHFITDGFHEMRTGNQRVTSERREPRRDGCCAMSPCASVNAVNPERSANRIARVTSSMRPSLLPRALLVSKLADREHRQATFPR